MAEEIYGKLAEKILCKGSRIVPELFKMLADQKDAEILLALPGIVPEIKAKTGLDDKDIEKRLGLLFRKGVVFKSKKQDGIKYKLCREIGQFHDGSILWPEASRDFLDLWQRYMDEEWPEYSKLVVTFVKRPLPRIIPIEKTVGTRNQVLAFESVREIIESANRLAVTNCTCRLIAHKCDKPVEVCLQVGKAADYTLERGTGREISKKEAMDIIIASEMAGLIHVTVNRASDFTFICNCCDDCCIFMPLLIKEGRKLCDPSRFQSSVITEKCSGCGTCVEDCVFKAIEMVPFKDGEVADVNPEKCMGCGLCAMSCAEGAIKLLVVRDKEFIPV
jgi:ferredoxin